MKKLIGVTVFSLFITGCCSREVVTQTIHVPLALQNPCVFEKFTESEKDTMTEAVGRKIFRNQRGCEITHEENTGQVSVHNKAHTSKE